MGRAKTRKARVGWLLMSCITNLGLLALFKYADFFVNSLNYILASTGQTALLPAVRLTLPVGISFYTFQSMSYTIDVFRGNIAPEKSFLRFALYVAFFPQLVAGPILRSMEFLPQLHSVINLRRDNIRSGCHLFLVGLVKKVLVADQVAPLVNRIFESPHGLPSPIICFGALAFGIQIYCDFSGYTDMARGVARMMGLHIPINFNYPYAARSITDFWRRWHISLSTWLRDYLYIPLGGNRKGSKRTYENLMITMGLGGLWHGAGWNFVIWGLYQGVLLAIERMMGVKRKRAADSTRANSSAQQAPPPALLARALPVFRWVVCQYFVFLGWLIFRVHNFDDLVYCARKYVLFDFDFHIGSFGLGNVNPFLTAGTIFAFVALHACSYRMGGLAASLDRMRPVPRSLSYFAASLAMIALWPTARTAFIYFQF